MPTKPLTAEQRADAARLNDAFRAWQAAGRRSSTGASTSQKACATALGFGQSALSQYLRGRIPLNAEALAKFAALLGVAPESISPRIVAQQRRLAGGLFKNESPVASTTGRRTASALAIPDDLYRRAFRVAALSGRTTEQQLTYWLQLGAAADPSLTAAQSLALIAAADGGAAAPVADDVPARLATRHAAHEAQVAAGERTPQSLFLIPKEMAKAARLTYPADTSQPW